MPLKLLPAVFGIVGLALLWVPHYTLLGFFALSLALLTGLFSKSTK